MTKKREDIIKQLGELSMKSEWVDITHLLGNHVGDDKLIKMLKNRGIIMDSNKKSELVTKKDHLWGWENQNFYTVEVKFSFFFKLKSKLKQFFK